jgi:hypothetical protein
MTPRSVLPLWVALFPVCLSATTAGAQTPQPHRLEVAAGAGFMSSGAYFTGPTALQLAAGDALAGALEVAVPVHRSFSIVVSGVHARPSFELSGLPLIGSVGVHGARIWFADAAVRGHLPLGPARPEGPTVFAQLGAGLAYYSVNAAVLGNVVDEHATNFAGALGAGIDLPLTRRLGLLVMGKDYIASFRSVRDLESLGIEGQRTHTLLLLASARLGI